MSNEIIDGDAHLGEDGILQGWCWNAQEPTERPVVDILIDGRVVSSNIASRFREDLRTRKIGDGYYGFMATLSKSIAEAGARFVLTARERRSGRCFWRRIKGDQALPGDFRSASRPCANACPASPNRPCSADLAKHPEPTPLLRNWDVSGFGCSMPGRERAVPPLSCGLDDKFCGGSRRWPSRPCLILRRP